MCSAILPLAWRYHADWMFIRLHIHGTIYTDTLNGRYKSLDGNKHAQILAFFATAYLMEHKSSAGQALKQFISDFSIPDNLVCDGAAEGGGCGAVDPKTLVPGHAKEEGSKVTLGLWH